MIRIKNHIGSLTDLADKKPIKLHMHKSDPIFGEISDIRVSLVSMVGPPPFLQNDNFVDKRFYVGH
jgi:hypothetical protein